jgi:putative ABC transport system permease protein
MKKLKDLQQEYLNGLRVGWFLAWRQLKRSSKGTTSLIIFIMVLTFLNLVVVSGLLLGLITGSFIQFKNSYSGEVIITSADGHGYIEDSPALVSYLERDPRVISISPRYAVSAQVLGTLNDLPKKNQRANLTGGVLVGIDPAREEAVTQFSRFVIKGQPLYTGDEGYILIGASLLKKYSAFADANIPGLDLLEDVDIGSRVRVSVSQNEGQTFSKDFIVKGIVKTKVDEISTRFFVVDQEVKRLLATNNLQLQEIAVHADDNQSIQLVADIKKFLGTHAARVQTSSEAIPSFLRDIETTMGVLGNALSSIALVVATITIFIVVFINAVTKRKFIGIMKGVGISPLAIQFSYVIQALFYGLSGSIIGTLITFGFLKPFFDAHPIDFPFSDGILVVTPASAAIRVAILIAVTLIAGYVPAKLIVRRNTLDAILGR